MIFISLNHFFFYFRPLPPSWHSILKQNINPATLKPDVSITIKIDFDHLDWGIILQTIYTHTHTHKDLQYVPLDTPNMFLQTNPKYKNCLPRLLSILLQIFWLNQDKNINQMLLWISKPTFRKHSNTVVSFYTKKKGPYFIGRLQKFFLRILQNSKHVML